jgi:hypothetical protein
VGCGALDVRAHGVCDLDSSLGGVVAEIDGIARKSTLNSWYSAVCLLVRAKRATQQPLRITSLFAEGDIEFCCC